MGAIYLTRAQYQRMRHLPCDISVVIVDEHGQIETAQAVVICDPLAMADDPDAESLTKDFLKGAKPSLEQLRQLRNYAPGPVPNGLYEDVVNRGLRQGWITPMPKGPDPHVAAMADDPDSKPTDAQKHVDQIIEDFNKGAVSRGDTIRVRDRADRALRDFGLVGGIGRGDARNGD